jgi:hypothetical protein
MSAINLANLGRKLTRVGMVFIPLRVGLAGLLIMLAVIDVAPLPFAAAAGGLMLALNVFESSAVYRSQKARGATT